MSNQAFPKHTKVLVIGGGPSGAMAATILARENIDVTVLEKSKFPRYHIGESLLNMYPILEFIDFNKKMQKFLIKDDAFFRIIPDKKPGHVNVRARGASKENTGYHVIRSEFDKLLLDHARENGAKVFEETCVNEIIFQNGHKPIAAKCFNKLAGDLEIHFDYLIDASGLSGILSNKYLKNRQYQETFANVALGGYWNKCTDYTDEDGKSYPGAFSMESINDGAGWCWAIPLHDDTLSVGTVIHNQTFKELRKTYNNNNESIYKHLLTKCPDVMQRIEGSDLSGAVRQWKDYSYIAESFSGENFRLVGDAAGFIDPLFSSGVYLATYGALSAAASICASINGELTEGEAGVFHDRLVGLAYSGFIMILSSIYPEIQTKHDFVLPSISENDLDSFFAIIQPLVSGSIGFAKQDTIRTKMYKVLDDCKELRWAMCNLEGYNPKIMDTVLGKAAEGYTLLENSLAIDDKYIRLEKGNLGIVQKELVEQ